MRNANPAPLLRTRTKDALLVGLFWLLLFGSAVGTCFIFSHFRTCTSPPRR